MKMKYIKQLAKLQDVSVNTLLEDYIPNNQNGNCCFTSDWGMDKKKGEV